MTMQSPTLNGHSFYIRQAGRTRGPVTARELVELARVGGLDPHAEISPDQKTWRRAARVKGLMELRFIGVVRQRPRLSQAGKAFPPSPEHLLRRRKVPCC